MNLKSPLGRLRLLALLEGISYLLLGITMPIKYKLGIPEPNFYVGMGAWMAFYFICHSCVAKYPVIPMEFLKLL